MVTGLLDTIRPTEKFKVFELLKAAQFNVTDWANFKGGQKKAAANPKYCYNWSFEKPNTSIAICIWHQEIQESGGTLVHSNNVRPDPVSNSKASARVWRRRQNEVDRHIRAAYLERLPLFAIVLDGVRRNRLDPGSKASSVQRRLLDSARWAVAEYDFESGDFLLVRGISPVEPVAEPSDLEAASFREGAARRAFRTHRHREWRARREKIEAFQRAHNGRLFCEVPNCEFDFHKQYGELGRGYAHVHHLQPLADAPSTGREVRLSDLAVICPNCHAMVHLGGECRPLSGLIKA